MAAAGRDYLILDKVRLAITAHPPSLLYNILCGGLHGGARGLNRGARGKGLAPGASFAKYPRHRQVPDGAHMLH